MRDIRELKYMQSLPLERKIEMTAERIRGWYEYYNGNVAISFSGGKDSTVLMHIARNHFLCDFDIKGVFIDTGLEYSEIRKFVKTFDNVEIIRPKMNFVEVIKKYGYPIISKEVSMILYYARSGGTTGSYCMKKLDGKLLYKGEPSPYNCTKWKSLLDTDFKISDKCCNVMKKQPTHEYSVKNGVYFVIAEMASESRLRQQKWLQHGCNGFDMKYPKSTPMAFWTEQDVLEYIYKYIQPKFREAWQNVQYLQGSKRKRARKFLKIHNYSKTGIAEPYGEVIETECQYTFDGEQCKYATTGCDRTGCMFCAFGAHLEKGKTRFQRLKETHPKQYNYCLNGGEFVDGLWQPNKQGLGMRYVFDELNSLYGDDFIRYE